MITLFTMIALHVFYPNEKGKHHLVPNAKCLNGIPHVEQRIHMYKGGKHLFIEVGWCSTR